MTPTTHIPTPDKPHAIGERPAQQFLLADMENEQPNADELILPTGSSCPLTALQAQQLRDDCIADYDAKKSGMESWREKRRRWLKMHEQDYSHRLDKTDTNIFNHNNVSLDVCKSDALRSAGRLQRDLIDTWPYYGLTPEGWKPNPDGTIDKDLARDMERYAFFKTRRTGLTDCLADGLDVASVLGEAVVKTTHHRVVEKYKTRAVVLCERNGTPYRTAAGDVIYQSDAWEQEAPPLVAGAPDPENAAPGEAVEPPPAPVNTPPAPGTHRLAKDPSFVYPVDGVWLKKLVEAQMVHYDGPCSKVVHLESFHAPLNCEDLLMASGLYFDLSMSLSEVRAKYGIIESPIQAGDDQIKETRHWLGYLVNWVKKTAFADSAPKSPDTQPNPTDGEGTNHRTQGEDAQVQIVEAYRLIDIDGDGVPERLMVLLDMEHKEILWWDYLANVTPDGRPPVRVIRKRAKKHRWYGIGDYEEGETDHDQIDYFVNRAIFNASFAGQIAGYDESACADWKTSPPKVGTAQWYKMANGTDMKQAVSFADIPQISDSSMEFWNVMMQKHTLSKPAIQPGQQNVANLPSSKLATGIKALMDVADDLYSPQRREAEKTVTDVILAHLECLFYNMKDEDAFEYTEGQSTLLGRLPRQKVQDLKINARLTMSRVRNLEASEKAKVAEAMIEKFHTVLPPNVQAIVAPFYVDQFSAMEIPNGESYFIPQELPPPLAMAAPQPGPGGKPPEPQPESL